MDVVDVQQGEGETANDVNEGCESDGDGDTSADKEVLQVPPLKV